MGTLDSSEGPDASTVLLHNYCCNPTERSLSERLGHTVLSPTPI